MQLVKHTHACVEIGPDGSGVLIDPGSFSTDAAALVARANAVLITHEHFDHVAVDVLDDALRTRSDLSVWGPAAVTERWRIDHSDRVHAVADGDRFTANGVDVAVHGDLHASIHADIPQVTNVGYLLEGKVYHPGDAYHVPDSPVDTLLLPTSGPWTKLGEAVDYVRAVRPNALIQIHEVMLSDQGQKTTATILSPQMLSQVPLIRLAVGDMMDV